MNRFVRRGLITLGAGAAMFGAVLFSTGVSGGAVAGKGVTVVAGTNWDRAPGTDWAGPTWAGPTWAGPTANWVGSAY
ncbi:hypothetical protein M1L60_07370 [Actinoplanes sp. TRM 88003]|uniref:Uncharacterized protein n=1 Tax=Paractinoplanes aksuensis TaxID=2939490 RepID=A0ABT1DHU9_9ACTN|nr:hypothetical protein [Actinoplanes aksuensis]MCO8270414.1 hypothetical protein [Actinoplanes aksuensis]